MLPEVYFRKYQGFYFTCYHVVKSDYSDTLMHVYLEQPSTVLFLSHSKISSCSVDCGHCFCFLNSLSWNLPDFLCWTFPARAFFSTLQSNSSLDNFAARQRLAIPARAEAASQLRVNLASDELPWVEDQLGYDAEQESCGAGGVQHHLNGDCGHLLFSLYSGSALSTAKTTIPIRMAKWRR